MHNIFMRLRSFVDLHPNFSIWLGFFMVTLTIILLVQLILLPYIFPNWHAGDGLVRGGDWVSFHRVAIQMAERMDIEGWEAWEIRPRGWMPAGVAGAIYALTWPKPWAIAPLNAAIHATTALLMIKLLLIFTASRKVAFIAAIPFVFFPSAMLWYTQIHRDGYNILGMLLFVFGILKILKSDSNSGHQRWAEGLGLLAAISGILLIWLVRPYALNIFYYVLMLIMLLLTLYFSVQVMQRKFHFKRALIKILSLGLILLVIFSLSNTEGTMKYQREPLVEQDSLLIEELQEKTSTDEGYYWVRTKWLPGAIDNHFYSMAVIRSVEYPEKYGETKSGIDYDVSLHSFTDYLFYLPRSLQIAFLAPFPSDWFKEGKYDSTTFFRKVSAFEMLFIYMALVSLIYGLWLWRKKVETYLVLTFCTIMMLPIVFTVPNVGTIYRYRYGYLMLLVSLGVAAFYQFVQNIREKKEIEKVISRE